MEFWRVVGAGRPVEADAPDAVNPRRISPDEVQIAVQLYISDDIQLRARVGLPDAQVAGADECVGRDGHPRHAAPGPDFLRIEPAVDVGDDIALITIQTYRVRGIPDS